MLRKLNATQNHSARTGNTAAYHVVYKDGLYRVFDKSGKFRLGFATPDAANAYIALRTVGARSIHAQPDV